MSPQGEAETRYFGTPTSNLLGIITASLFLPAIFCSFLGDWLCTRFGRRITVMVGSVFIIAGGAWNGMSQSLAHFIACAYLLPVVDETDASSSDSRDRGRYYESSCSCFAP